MPLTVFDCRRRLLKLLAGSTAVSLAGCNLRYALLGFPTPKVSAQWPASGPIEIPFRTGPGGLVLIRGTVNGRAELDFILDTGAPVSVLLNGPPAKALALDTRNARKLGDADNPATPVGVITSGFNFDFSSVQLSELTAVVIEADTLPCPERYAAIGFNGVVGADLFKHFVVQVDHHSQTLRLYRPGTMPSSPNANVLPLVFDDGHAYIDAATSIAGAKVPLHLHVDTGKNIALTLIAGTRPELVMPAAGATRVQCLVQGRVEARSGPPIQLQLASMNVAVPTPYYQSSSRTMSRFHHGAIGVDLLREFVFAVDYPAARLVLQPRA